MSCGAVQSREGCSDLDLVVVELRGLEPLTPCLQRMCGGLPDQAFPRRAPMGCVRE
jgi:hypothetical protein